MSDRQDPYGPQDPYAHDPYGQEQQGHTSYTYDAYGRPVYRDAAQSSYEQHYDAYGQQTAPSAYEGYDPYGGHQGGQAPQGQQGYQGQAEYGYDAYGRPQVQDRTGYPQQYDPYAQPQQPPQQQPPQQEWIPQQAQQAPYEQTSYADGPRYDEPAPQRQDQPPRPPERRRAPADDGDGPGAPGGAPGSPGEDPEYRTEQFSFIEEPDEDSEDVIDWLKFTESRTERREEAKRRGRSRIVALSVVLALLVAGGVGYLWWAGKLPGLDGPGAGQAAAAGGQKRDVLVVHLRDTKSGNSSTALLVDNTTTHKGTTVLLPNSLVVPKDDGSSTTLGKSVKDDGTEPTRDSLNSLLGADLKASWRLDTPYLENLVETVGGITLDTDATVPGAKKGDSPAVKQGSAQDLNGQAAVAYATYQAPGEPQTRQLQRFGQVMQATLKKVSSDADGATATVKSLLQVLDPPLTEGQLGSSLAQRAELAKTGAYRTTLLPVQANGTLSQAAAAGVVKDVLGGTVKKTAPDATARVAVRNATGTKAATNKAQVALLNGGYSFVDAGTAGPAATSRITYADTDRKAKAAEVAKTLGLPAGVVRQGKGASNADITVVLGQDYKG
ncbi:LytR C-terminal domain-containing protein [Streptomyces sp. DSM 41527]|uniref:LytR C-terminal domain-containing protein n=1 Tax=Streptomyces mooreae TaxID=3075523 RepID=A0ABU2T680_9ACTN|nr:LytR C-terminal domain-containing protein [Streptomyces sp. DSM 41527]MDT0456498.1 LytR C-terminal domain-containing protein [Streptomyces sp. DSM 41527]